MNMQTVQAANGTAVIARGEIVNLKGDWTLPEMAGLLEKLESMEGAK